LKRSLQNTLYHLLPVVFWLLAAGVCVLPFLSFFPFHLSLFDFLPALLAWVAAIILHRIRRHDSSVEQCFLTALLLGVAAYWLPSVVFLVIPAWGYLIYRHIFSFRSFLASLIGFAVVAVWLFLLAELAIIDFHFSLAYNLYAWLPTAAVLVAWIASSIVRNSLRVR
jgi:hypothetical protein